MKRLTTSNRAGLIPPQQTVRGRAPWKVVAHALWSINVRMNHDIGCLKGIMIRGVPEP